MITDSIKVEFFKCSMTDLKKKSYFKDKTTWPWVEVFLFLFQPSKSIANFFSILLIFKIPRSPGFMKVGLSMSLHAIFSN